MSSEEPDDLEMLRAAMRNATCMIDMGRAGGLESHLDEAVGWVVAHGIPHPGLNAVRPVHQHAGLAERVSEIVGTYPPHLPVGWWVMSDEGHDEIAASLALAGFEIAVTMPVVAGPVPSRSHEPPSDLTITEPADDDDWTAVATVQRDAFELPDSVSTTIARSVRAMCESEPDSPTFQVALAKRSGEPISVGFVSHRAGVAGLWSLATLPSARGKGVGGAMVDHRLGLARTRGDHSAFMVSGGNAESLYAARGFRRIGIAELHVLSPRA